MISCGQKELVFEVLGKAQPQQRPIFNSFTKSARDPKKSSDYKATVRALATMAVQEQGWAICHRDMPVAVEIINYRSIPKALPKWQQKAALEDQIVPLTKGGDLDNIAKGILDAMTSVVYEDDAQVFKLNCEAKYSDIPRVVVKVIGYYTNIGDIKEAAMKDNVRLAADVRAAAKRVAKAKGGK